MSEPSRSFAEWRCARCSRVARIETVGDPLRVAWPAGWIPHRCRFEQAWCASCAKAKA